MEWPLEFSKYEFKGFAVFENKQFILWNKFDKKLLKFVKFHQNEFKISNTLVVKHESDGVCIMC